MEGEGACAGGGPGVCLQRMKLLRCPHRMLPRLHQPFDCRVQRLLQVGDHRMRRHDWHAWHRAICTRRWRAHCGQCLVQFGEVCEESFALVKPLRAIRLVARCADSSRVLELLTCVLCRR